MKKILKVFKNRILIFYLISVFFFFTIVLVFLSSYLREKNINFYKENLKLTIDTVALIIENDKNSIEKLNEISKKVFRDKNIRLTFIKKDGKVIADSIVETKDIEVMENHLNRKEVIEAFKYGDGFSVRFSSTAKKELIYYSVLKKINGEDLVIRASVDFKRFKNDLNSIKNDMFLFMSSILSIFIIFGFILIKKITEPIDKIVEASKQYAKGNFSYKINIDFQGELKKLAQTLNTMSKEIEKDIKDIRYKNKILSLIFDGMKEGIFILSEKKEIIDYNTNFLKILLLKHNDIKGKKFNEIIRDWELIKAVEDLSFKELKKEIKLLNGKYIGIIGFKIDLDDEKKYVFVIYDIDEEKKLEIMKQDFIANFSHEIKTPLTVIKANLETILNENLDNNETKKFLVAIEKNVSRMENIVKDIIKLSYIERGIKIERKEINLEDITSKIIQAFDLKIKEKNIKVIIDLNHKYLNGEPALIEDAFFNLIDNAIKYNFTNGEIKITSQNNNKEIKIIFENSGPKIPDEYLERIFERFFVVDKSRSRSVGGTGLGLSIVKHIVELHNGKIYAESFKDLNRFTMILPAT